MGRIIGISIWKMRASVPAPSMAEASRTSFGMEVKPASRMTVENGSMRQTWMVMIATIPSVVSPSQ